MKFTFSPESRPLEGFTIKRAIHRGGFGEVYYAVSDGGREVALKLLRNDTEIELRGIRQCLNLSHSNLVKIFDVRQDGDGDHWIVMEYISGPPLDRIISSSPQGMPMQDVRQWVRGVVAGVEYLHNQGLVHRDLKPANLFLDGKTVKVGDVGLSKYIQPSRRSAQTQSVGTVYYMAPEVAKGRYGREVDVYALSVIVYEMLTGRVPFDGESTGEILMKHLTESPDLSKVPERVRPVLARGLEKDPEKRFRSVTDFGAAFEAAVVGRPVPGEPPAATPEFATAAADTRASAPQTGPAVGQGLGSDLRRVLDVPTSYSVLAVLFVYAVWRFALPGVTLPGFVVLLGVVGIGGWAVFRLFSLAGGATRQMANELRDSAFLRHKPAKQDGIDLEVNFAAVRDNVTREAYRRAERCGRDAKKRVKKLLAKKRLEMKPRVPVGLTHWTGAAALAPLCVAVLVAGLSLTLDDHQTFASLVDADHVFLVLSATLAIWTIVASGLLIERQGEDAEGRRSLQALAGVVTGTGMYRLGEWLMIDWENAKPGWNPFHEVISKDQLVTASGDPTMLSLILFMAALFAILRWWNVVDSYRSRRFRISTVVLASLLAFGLASVIPVDRSWAILWTAIVASGVQLVSPWVPIEDRWRSAADVVFGEE